LGSKGRAHSNAEVISYMKEAGFTDVAATEFVRNILQRVTGWKR
jgi:hypothetical protein